MQPFRYALTSQPQGFAEIDASNPLCAGLAACGVGGVPVNLVTGIAASSRSAIATIGVSRPGIGRKYSSTGSVQANVDRYSSITAGSQGGVPMTVFSLSIQTSTGSIQSHFGDWVTNAGMAIRPNSSNQHRVIAFDGAAKTATGPSISIGSPAFVVGRADGTNLTLFVNGKKEATTACGSLASWTPDFGVGGAGVSGFGGTIFLWGVFTRALSDAECRALSTNPWQIFAAPARPIFVGFDAAVGTTDNLTAQSISTSSPTITQASVGQTHALSGQPTETAAPTVSAPALGQIHALSSQSISTSAPEIATPTLTSASTVDNLIAQALSTGQITITQAALAQIHVLTAQSLSTSAPTISTPAITAAANFDNLTAQDIVAGVPTISTPGVTQIHFLPAQSISTSAPTVTNAVLGSAGLAVWPTPDQVLAGTPYGPTGADYTGTAIAGSYPTAADIAAAVRAEMAAELARIDATISSRSTVAAIMGATAP